MAPSRLVPNWLQKPNVYPDWLGLCLIAKKCLERGNSNPKHYVTGGERFDSVKKERIKFTTKSAGLL